MSRYDKSRSELERVKKIIPLASQTFSKAYNRWPKEAPHFLLHGWGGRVWDIDGNEYVDMVSSLLPVVLGYCDKDVDRAIAAQLGYGISFSLPTLSESELAGRLIRHVPCAEMVRFGKSGTDATSAAVRLARAVTGRDHIIMCGYHGWQDWSIATADNPENRAGVPQAVRDLTTQIRPGEKIELDILSDVAAIIVDCSKIDAAYAEHLRKVADYNGAILIFDEVITGFRYHIGGCQKLWGVTPDLACFSKALGNGMPISAVVGRADLMQNFDHVFFSGTYGGETLSIAAAIATIDKIHHHNVCDHLALKGKLLLKEFTYNQQVWLSGHPSFLQINYGSPEIKERYVTEMLARGILVNTTLNVNYAHSAEDISRVIDAHYMAWRVVKDMPVDPPKPKDFTVF